MIIFLLLFGCRTDQGPNEGTIVGNPGDAISVLSEGTDIQFVEAFASLSSVSLFYDGNPTPVDFELEDELDLLSPIQSIALTSGTWNSVLFSFDSVYISGENTNGTKGFEIEIEAFEIHLEGQEQFTLTDKDYILELGNPGWLEDRFLEDYIEDEILIEQEDEGYLEIQSTLQAESVLFLDTDSDGDINDEERNVHGIAYSTDSSVFPHSEDDQNDTAESDMLEESSDKSTLLGCNGTSKSYFLGSLFVVAFLRRRQPKAL